MTKRAFFRQGLTNALTGISGLRMIKVLVSIEDEERPFCFIELGRDVSYEFLTEDKTNIQSTCEFGIIVGIAVAEDVDKSGDLSNLQDTYLETLETKLLTNFTDKYLNNANYILEVDKISIDEIVPNIEVGQTKGIMTILGHLDYTQFFKII